MKGKFDGKQSRLPYEVKALGFFVVAFVAGIIGVSCALVVALTGSAAHKSASLVALGILVVAGAVVKYYDWRVHHDEM